MSTDQLRILLSQYNIEFLKKLQACHEDVIHLGVGHDKHFNFHMKAYIYLIKKPYIKITYRERVYTRYDGTTPTPRTFVLNVHYVCIGRGNLSFYGHTTEYGHNVYITADESFLTRIIKIEKR